jgi:hypothetical protein
MATPTELARLAAAITVLRPDWPAVSIRTLLDKPTHRDRPIHDLTVALAWIATDGHSHTPGRLDKHGPWWTCLNADAQPGPPRMTPGEFTYPDATPMPDHLRQLVAEHQAKRTNPRSTSPRPIPDCAFPDWPVSSPIDVKPKECYL